MLILTVHNKYLIRGGEDESREAQTALLRAKGHEVIEFVLDNRQIERMSRIGVGLGATWNGEVYGKLRTTIRKRRPEIVDVQNFFPLGSPAVYYAAHGEGVPVVQTLHNFRLLCPGATLFRRDMPCEKCVGRRIPWPGIVHGCYRDSRAGSAAVTGMIAVHRLLGTWGRKIDLFVALTDFARKKFIEGGLPPDKITVKPNFVPGDFGPGDGAGGYALYVGRLSSEKGLATLLGAWRLMKGSMPLRIVGDGPLRRSVQIAAQGDPSIQWLGIRSLGETYDLMGHARCLVFPSTCYEGMPRTIIEALAQGTPVVSSGLGSMVEMVEHGRTGLLVTPGNPPALASALDWVGANNERVQAMRIHARAEFEAKYTAELNYTLLIGIYEQARQNHGVRRHALGRWLPGRRFLPQGAIEEGR
jgi:glycosyltransferase involved in cell wall biosynthesis